MLYGLSVSSPIICTIIAKNYLAQARCLTESFLRFHPEGKVFVLVIDEVNDKFDPRKERFETILLRDLKILKLPEMIERYSIAELSTAVKPYFLQYLLEKENVERVCYFDPDIYFYGPIDQIWNELEKSAIILTPHVLGPLDEEYRPNEFTVFQAGIFNLGFLGLARGKESGHLLPWWQERLVKYAHNAPEKNEHYDQKWMDLIPGFYDKVMIDRSPGYNVAYWDLSNRNVTEEGGRYFVNGQPLTFFHFSGYTPEQPEVISKYQERFTLAKEPVLKQIFDEYGERLFANGYQEITHWPIEVKNLREKQEEKPAPAVGFAPGIYRTVTSGLASLGLERPLTTLVGSSTIRRLQNVFLQPRPIRSRWDSQLTAGVNVLGFFEHAGGVGEVARRSVRALAETGVPVNWKTLEGAGGSNSVSESLPKTSDETLSINMWHVNADILPAMMAQHREIAENGATNVAYWAWELPEFPKDWANRKNLLQEIWVGSSFVKAAIESQLDIPVHVLGAPIYPIKPEPTTRARLGLPEDKFMFLFVFDMASYIERKNPWATIEAYRQAFGEKPTDALLSMKVLNAQRFPVERKNLARALASVGGRLIEETLDHQEMQSLMNSCDAYISLHRSEGFGVTMAEAMSYGKPVIATNYSGNADYMDETNSYPVPYRLVSLENDIGPYRMGSTWAAPDVSAAAAAMRRVFENPKEAKARGERAARDITERYSFLAFAKRIEERLRVLTGQPARAR